MKNLNQSWLLLIGAGVVFLLFYFFWTLFEGLSGANSEFVHTSAPFQSNTILSPILETHLVSNQTSNQ